MTTLDEQRLSNLALVAGLARVERLHGGESERGLRDRLGVSLRPLPDDEPNPLGVKYELAETMACKRCQGHGIITPAHGKPFNCYDCRGDGELVGNSADKGTGRVLRPVDLDDEVSVGEALGRLMYLVPSRINPRHEALMLCLDCGDLPAAEDAIGELLIAMQRGEK